MSDLLDTLIIGGGPAGVSAAVYLFRAGKNVSVTENNHSALHKASEIENYYAAGKISGRELYEKGLDAARTLGVPLLRDEVTELEQTSDGFTARTAFGKAISAKTAVLATGAVRPSPKLPGIEKFEGSGVSYCAVCDAFFFRGKTVGVYGNGAYARSEAAALANVTQDITIFLDGKQPEVDFLPQYRLITEPLQELYGTEKLAGVRGASGTDYPLSGFFIASGSADASALARKLGLPVDGGLIAVDAGMATAIPGLFACGDCVNRFRQVATAVAGGAVCAMSVIKKLNKKEDKE